MAHPLTCNVSCKRQVLCTSSGDQRQGWTLSSSSAGRKRKNKPRENHHGAMNLAWRLSPIFLPVFGKPDLLLSQLGSSLPAIAVIILTKHILGDGLSEVCLTGTQSRKGRRKLCGMEAADKWGWLVRQSEEWESDGSHFTRYLTYGLISLSGLGNRASKQWRKVRKQWHTKYNLAVWEQKAGFYPHDSWGICVHHLSSEWGNS